MTPSKTKKALPSSTSMAFPDQPSTYDQWKTALVHVKTLYLKGQWKQCAARCNQLLLEAKTPPHPLHATYLHFYNAISNESIASSMHSLSSAKLSALERAKKAYQAAAAALPVVEDVNVQWVADDDERSESSTGKESRPSTPRSGQPELLEEFPSPPSSVSSDDEFCRDESKMVEPSLLRIRAVTAFPDSPTVKHPTPQTPSTPPQTRHLSTTTLSNNNPPTSPPSPSPHNTPLPTLPSFSSLLTTHILTTTSLIQTTQCMQAARHTSRRLASYGEDEETKAADRKERILRGRECGWRRERFRPERYWGVCERALGSCDG